MTLRRSTSAPHRISSCVPQGSVLTSLWFSLYTGSFGQIISALGFLYYCYMDDTQLTFPFFPSSTPISAQILACLAGISSWMATHNLKHNPSKTEILFITGDSSLCWNLAILLDNSLITPSITAHDLGEIMDMMISPLGFVNVCPQRSVRCLLNHFGTGLLQLTLGRPTSERQLASANDAAGSLFSIF